MAQAVFTSRAVGRPAPRPSPRLLSPPLVAKQIRCPSNFSVGQGWQGRVPSVGAGGGRGSGGSGGLLRFRPRHTLHITRADGGGGGPSSPADDPFAELLSPFGYSLPDVNQLAQRLEAQSQRLEARAADADADAAARTTTTERIDGGGGGGPRTYPRVERSEQQNPGGGYSSYYYSESVTTFGGGAPATLSPMDGRALPKHGLQLVFTLSP